MCQCSPPDVRKLRARSASLALFVLPSLAAGLVGCGDALPSIRNQVLALFNQVAGLFPEFPALSRNVIPALLRFLGQVFTCLFARSWCIEQRHHGSHPQARQEKGQLRTAVIITHQIPPPANPCESPTGGFT